MSQHTFRVGQTVRVYEKAAAKVYPDLSQWPLAGKRLSVVDVRPVPQQRQRHRGHHQEIRVSITGQQGSESDWMSGAWFEPVTT